MAAAHAGFRANEINFLQDENRNILTQLENVEKERDDALAIIKACEAKDDGFQSELQAIRDKIGALATKVNEDKMLTVSKDEHVKVLSEQNKQMIQLLENEETKSRDHQGKISEFESKNRKLQRIAEEFDVEKARIEGEVAEAKNKSCGIISGVKNHRSLNEMF
jgi:chromosome segregation ATPase